MRILTSLCCYYHRDLQSSFGPADVTARLRPEPDALLADHPLRGGCPRVSAAGLSPVHFLSPQAHPVSCDALLREWLLPSLSPGCLSLGTSFGLTLNPHLGALTLVTVVPVSAMGLTPMCPAPAVYTAHAFGV